MEFLKRHRTALASGLVLVVAAASLTIFALSTNGYPVRHVDLNDGGIWVTSDGDGLFGRLNQPAGALDGAFYPPGGARSAYQLDVAQDGAAVVAWDQTGGKLFPVDVDRSVSLSDHGVPVSSEDQVQMAGGTLAVLDPRSGKLWATRLDTTQGVTSLSALEPSTAPLATVDGGGASLAVGQDGSVYAVSASGNAVTVRPDDPGFAGPQRSQFNRTMRDAGVTAVGDQMVALEVSTGSLVLPGGQVVQLPNDPATVLQQPGPAADSVIVATSKALLSVGLSDGQVTTLSGAGTGTPAAPVRLDACVHAAWAGTPGAYVRSCDGGPARAGNLRDLGALVRPAFRVNRDEIVLNDLATGAVWDLQSRQKVDDWSSVKPPPVQQPNDKSKNNDTTQAAQNQPPKAVDDTLGARPGRTTVLHVLDNDSDPGGNILSVASVTAPDNPAANLAIAPDGQTVEIAMPPGSGDVHFKYTVDDDRGLNATASVTVQARTPDENKVPELRLGYQPRTATVPAGGELSLPVLGDWRDFDGDPVVLVSARAPAGSVTTTPDGFLDITAPTRPGPETIAYQVSDGIGAPVSSSAQVVVQSPTATTPVAATAEPDVARGEAGQPISIRPLANDLPGADPTDPTAHLALAGPVAAVAGLTVATDTTTGVVTVTGERAGTYVLQYDAAYGNAPFAKGTIRVDVTAPPASPAPPVAMPDTAVLHGQSPVLVDVLANDYDPSGQLLAVQRAVAADPTQLQVAAVKGRWLRINALTPSINPNPQLVHYTMTDGISSPVTGEVSVTELPAPANDTPVPQDDYATVRAGDSVTIPVLDNDTDPGGDPITLASDVPGAPASGQLTVTSAQGTGNGTAYVSGNRVVFVAPSSVPTPRTVTVDYVAQDRAGDQAVGHAHVTIDPAPTATNPDQAPTPQPVEARAVAGDTVVLTVPTTGVDPDGDSVTVTGIASAPTLGRVTSIGATSLTYQAYPSGAGTDTFTYQVADRYGRSGQASVRVAVVPPGDPQPPVAVDDVVTAAPGAHVSVDPLANDVLAPDDTVTITPLGPLNPGLGDAASLTGPSGPVQVTAPGLTGKPLVVRYADTDGIGDPSTAGITVRSQQGYDIPPIAVDAYPRPEPGARTVTADVLAGAADPDGDSAKLVVSRVYAAGATVRGGHVTLPVLDHPQNVPFEIRDAGGATAVAVIHVPATGSGAPYLKAGQTITLAKNGTTTANLADLVVDPAGKPVRLTTTDQIWASPASGLTAHNQGDTKLDLTAQANYVGPASVTFQVTDGSSLTDPRGQTAVLTVPVQIGPPTPVLRCPTDPLRVVEGGAGLKVDVVSVCHVWLPDPNQLAGLKFTASWQHTPSGVDLAGSGSHTLSVTASGSAAPGSGGTLTVGVAGSDATPATLPVQVTAAAPPSVAPVTVDGVKAGDTATVDLASYVRSELRDPVIGVVNVSQTGGMPANAAHSGSTVRLTPSSGAHGTITFTVVVADVADTGRADRHATGQITLHVLGVPDSPGAPQPGRTVMSRVVELSWSTPANNGAPVDSYQVDYSGGSQTCPASPCDITGLANGTSYVFTVRAHNLVGWSQPSGGSAPAQPNTVPGAVTGLTTADPQDGTLQVSWTAPPDDGTPVEHYQVSWTGGGSQTVSGSSMTASGLVNDDTYTFTVVPVNSQGPGPAATVQGQSAGAPAQPAAPTVQPTESTDGASTTVAVSWPADDPNGPGPSTYTVTRGGGGGTKTVCANTTALVCDDDGLTNDGTVYTYTLTAANSAPGQHASPASPGSQITATGHPAPVTNASVAATGTAGQATVSFDAPASHGASSTVSCVYGGGSSCGSWTFSTAGQAGVRETINGLPNGVAENVTLRDCNGGTAADSCDSAVSSGSVTTYGPIQGLSIATSASGQTVNFTVSVDPDGKPATVNINTSRQTQTFTTGAGAWSWSSSDNVGYSSSDTVSVTVSDPGRATVSGSKTQGTPAPPPPPPSVTVSRGALCGGGGGSACAGGSCTNSSCGYIHVATANFSGTVTCTFNSQHGTGGFINENYAPNQSKDSYNWYGWPGEWVTVTCGGVSGTYTWP